MKKYIRVLFLLFVGLVAVLFMKEMIRWSAGPLLNVQRQINSQADIVYKTGQDSKITFVFPEENGTLVISPPYAIISGLGKDVFSPELQKKMQSFVDSQETGHLFYIKQGRLVDHRLLSGLAEPILGVGTKKEIVFLLSRKSTASRPVRIEILNQ